ncbi:MAG: arginine--tRNA ligase [Candidatus Margulisbacteria bacterium]|nr:arginine--tRNA ligase [Candidatus Margulisiibacteriota bacterium]
MIKKTLEKKLQKIWAECGFPFPTISLELPKNTLYGDYATNIAFSLTKDWRMSPQHAAEKLCDAISTHPEFANSVVFNVQNGFINLRLSDAFLWEQKNQATAFPETTDSTLLEYVSANPTGPLHIGHGRWAVLGSTLFNLLSYVGMPVKSEFYINDAGNQIVKFYNSVDAARKKEPIPEDGYHGAYIHDLAASAKDPLQANLDHHKETLFKLGITFDIWFSEKTLHDSGEVVSTIEQLKKAGMTYEKEGALWFSTVQFGDDKDRVLIKADGALTYFAVDIAYHQEKIKRGFSRLINIWGADHHGYVNRVRAGVAALCGKHFLSEAHFHFIIGQLVSLMRGGEPVRMSKRTGDMITLDEVIDEIGSDATRFFLVNKGPDTHIEFDLELAKTKSAENPVYYIQYAHARLSGILKKITQKTDAPLANWELNPTERQLLLHCVQMPDVLWEAAQHLVPHRVAHYAFQMARYIHLFYETCPIAQADPKDQEKRLLILVTAQKTLAEALTILGISAPTEM